MKKTLLLFLLVITSIAVNAQTHRQQTRNDTLYIEVMGDNYYKVHSKDYCRTIKNSIFDDKTKFMDPNSGEFESPYRDVSYNAAIFFCNRCMTQDLIDEFTRRLKRYKNSGR